MLMMKILFATNDADLIQMIEGDRVIAKDRYVIHNNTNNPLDLMSAVCTINPGMLILDDDFFEPNSAHVLKSIRKVNRNIAIIFITSNTSVHLGREISQLAIHYYAHKPLDKNEILDSIKSFARIKKQSLY